MKMFFMHIPKTAGTSFRRLLEGRFAPCDIFPDECTILRNGEIYPHPQDLMKIFRLFGGAWEIGLFRGHYHYQVAPHFLGEKFLAITMLRNPVDRYISHVRHYLMSELAAHNAMSGDAHTDMHGLLERAIVEEKYPHIRDLMVKFLRGNFSAQEIFSRDYYGMDVPAQREPVTPDDVRQAMERLGRFFHVGIVEDFATSVKRLCWKLGWQVPGRMPMENVNRMNGNDFLSPKAREKVREYVRHDLMLYDHVMGHLV